MEEENVDFQRDEDDEHTDHLPSRRLAIGLRNPNGQKCPPPVVVNSMRFTNIFESDAAPLEDNCGGIGARVKSLTGARLLANQNGEISL